MLEQNSTNVVQECMSSAMIEKFAAESE